MSFWRECLWKPWNREGNLMTGIATDPSGPVVIVTNPPNWSLLRGTHFCLHVIHQYCLGSFIASMNPCWHIWESPRVHIKTLKFFLQSFCLRRTDFTFLLLILSIGPGWSDTVSFEGGGGGGGAKNPGQTVVCCFVLSGIYQCHYFLAGEKLTLPMQ